MGNCALWMQISEYRKASFRGAPSAHPDWIVPSVDEEVEVKFQRTI